MLLYCPCGIFYPRNPFQKAGIFAYATGIPPLPPEGEESDNGWGRKFGDGVAKFFFYAVDTENRNKLSSIPCVLVPLRWMN